MPETTAATRERLVFDGVEVDPLAHRVVRDGQLVTLEPKAYAVLLEFLARPGEMLARDHLLDMVWGHRHVTPAVLSRVIAQLRKVLGDDAAEPRCIETVHGIGYRFVAKVRRVAMASADAVVAADVAACQPEASDGSSASLATSDRLRRSGDHAPTARASATPRKRPWLAATAIAIALLASVVIAQWYRSHEVAASTPAAPAVAASLAVLPFTARGDDPELSAAAEGLAESLTDAFARLPALRVAGRESVFALARGSSSPQRVAEQLGVDYALGGELVPVKDGLDLRLGLWRRGEAAPVWLDVRTAPRAQLFRVLTPITDRVRATLAPTSVALPVRDTSVTVQDIYWLGRHYWYRRTPESLARALGYFQRAVAEDPQFALGYCGLSDSYMLLFEYGDISLDEATTKARAAIAEAKSLEPSLADAYASEGLILLDEGRYDDAVSVLAHAAEIAPRHPTVVLWYGTALAYAGRPRDAIEWHRRAAELDPLNAVVETYLGHDYVLAGDEEQATAHLRHALELNPDYPEPYWKLAVQHAFHGRLGEAAVVLAEARKHQGVNDWTAYRLAYTELLAGDGASARRTLQNARGISPLDFLEVEARSLLIEGHADTALQAIDASKPGASTALRHAALRARSLGLLGRNDEARAIYDDLFTRNVAAGDPFVQPRTPDFAFGHFSNWIALLPADSSLRPRAIAALRDQLDRLVRGGVNLPLLGYQQAIVAALDNDAASAERELRGALDRGWLDAAAFDRDLAWRRFHDAPWLLAVRAIAASRVAKERDALSVTGADGH